jgi:glycosyltransferase involved in cell wall biosynthesis
VKKRRNPAPRPATARPAGKHLPNVPAIPDIPPKRGGGLNLLFIHQNFPAQYYHVAEHYAADPANTVIGLGEAANMRRNPVLPGVIRLGYDLPATAGKGDSSAPLYPYVRRYQAETRRGHAAARLMMQIRERGFTPDVICVHPAWGEALFIRLIWPDVPLMAYAETYAKLDDPVWDFDPAFPTSLDTRALIHAGNATLAVSYADATHLHTTTRFLWECLPSAFRERTEILYDGIHTGEYRPDPETPLILAPTAQSVTPENPPLPEWFPRRREPLVLTRADTVVTFVNRVIEPYRGWHSFTRAIPFIQKVFPEAHFVITGRAAGNGAYGPPPKTGNWRDLYLEEIRGRVDPNRLHLIGTVPTETVLRMLRVSKAHVYLTYPFVLSRSPVEAMSCATPLVFSDVAPTREVAEHEKQALFVDFHSPEDIAGAVIRLLREPEHAARLGQAARERVIREYDLEGIWLPQWRGAIERLARRGKHFL